MCRILSTRAREYKRYNGASNVKQATQASTPVPNVGDGRERACHVTMRFEYFERNPYTISAFPPPPTMAAPKPA